MSNVGNRYLLKLGKSSLCYKGLCGSAHEKRKLLHTSSPGWNERQTYEQSPESQSEQTRSSSSSSSNQQFHRHSYERKRTDYQRERARNKHSIGPLRTDSSITHYQRLSIEPESDITTIKSAYYALSKRYHPDIVGKDSPDSAEQFRLITESYDILSDPITRKEYDSTLGPTLQAPQFTSWQPSGSSNKERDHIFRMREASRIIKTKQDTFLEQERLKNPQKFRAGSFKADDNRISVEDEIARLDKRMQSLANCDVTSYSKKENADFYQMHLVNTIRRRREDLVSVNDNRVQGSSDDRLLATSILTVMGGFAFFALVIINQFIDIDMAASLDGKLEQVLEEIKILRRKD